MNKVNTVNEVKRADRINRLVGVRQANRVNGSNGMKMVNTEDRVYGGSATPVRSQFVLTASHSGLDSMFRFCGMRFKSSCRPSSRKLRNSCELNCASC